MRSSVTQPNREETARLLEAAGSAYDPEGVDTLIDGVLAAPAAVGTGWHRLVADPMPQQLAASLEALRAAVPGHRHGRVVVWSIVAMLTIVALLQLRQPIHWGWTPDVFLQFGLLDLWRTAALVAVPWAVLLIALRRGAPLASGRPAALAGAAAFGLTFVVMRFCCRTDELMHLAVFHVLPVLVGTALSAGLGMVLLPRWRSSSPA